MKKWTAVTKSVRINANDGLLVCPKCNGTYTHQSNIEVFNRTREDDPTGSRFYIVGGTVAFSSSMADNPSSRRQGVRIYFYCEHCHYEGDRPADRPPLYEMIIYQHKGGTFIEVVYHIEVKQ